MYKKKFSGVLLLLLLLVSCFVTASAGTAEALGLVAIERQGNKVYQRHLSFFDGHFIANAEREFYFAVTGQHAHPVRLELRVFAILKASYKNAYVNGKQLTSSGEPMFVSENFLSYGHSFPAPYDPNFFVAPFKIRLNGNEGDEYQFEVTAVDAITGEFLTFNINHVSIHKDKESEHPVIKSPVEKDSVTPPFPGTTTIFLGAATTNFSRWRVGYDKIDNKYKSAIADMSITDQNSEITTLTLTTDYVDGLTDGGSIGSLTVYAANQYGYEVSRDLKVNVAIAPKYQTPVIDNPTQELSVLYGAAAETVFTGEYISTWSCDKTALPGFIQDVNLDYSKNRNKCKVNVMLSPDAAIGSNYDLKLTASNGMNTKSAAATLKIKTVGTPGDYADPIIDGDETISVVQGGSASAVFTGRYVKRWGYKGDLPSGIDDIKFNYDSNPNRCEIIVTANPEAAVTSSPLSLNIYAYNVVGEEIKTPKTLYINILQNDKTAAPVINETAKEISVVPGGTATVTFTGQHTRNWSWEKANDNTTADIVKNIELNYASNPARCEVRVTLNDELAAGLTDTINIYAYNAVGTKVTTPATLTVKVASTGDNEDPVIDESEAVSVIKGGTAKAVFTGQHIRSWAYGTLPEAIHAVELRPAANPNRCDVLVTAADKTEATSAKVTIYACNAIGEVTSADLNVTILDNRDHSDPVIDCNESVSVIAGGTAKAVFTGQHINSWSYGNLPDDIKAVELNYAANPNRCSVLVTASSTAAFGEKTVKIYAYNEIGEETSANLNVTIVDTRDHSDPVIDYNESVSVIAGGTARAILTGKHINSWAHGTLPDGIKAVELNYAANPNRCDVLVTASSKAAAGAKTVTIYAYNEIGEETSADLSVTIINDSEKSKYNKPVIDGEKKSVSVAKGGTARAVFTGKNIRAWYYGNLPDGIKAIELNYAANPNKCEFLVTASSAATAGEKNVTIYAYNAVGEVTDKTLTVNIIDDSEKDKYAKPVINNSGLSVNVVKGGTVYTSLSGSNITSWAYGNLPDGIKSLEFIYNNNPNKCTAAVTASSAAELGARTITIYAFNEIGEYVSKTLNVTVIENSDSGDDPTIDSDDLKNTINVVPGGKISVSFDATNIYGLAYAVLPNEIEYVDWYVNDTGTKGAFFITASSTAKVGSKPVISVYGFNEIGEVSETATIKLTVVNDTGNKNPVTKKSESTIVVEPGEIIAAEFTSANAKNWDFNISELPNVVNAIDVSYDIDNPETCEVTIIASFNTSLFGADYDNSASDVSSAADTTHSFKVYAYNEIGSATSGDFAFTVSDSGSSTSSSSGCNSGMSGLTLAVALTLIYYLTSRKLKIN